MGSPCAVVVMTAESQTAQAISAALQSDGRYVADSVCRTPQELAGRLARGASAVVVDIDSGSPQVFQELESMVRRCPEARFVVLASDMRSDWILSAMQAGARHFLLKNAIAGDLAQVLDRLLSDRAGEDCGAMVTVLSAGGGCGATTLAINLATELRVSSGAPVLLVDLDDHCGGIGAYLGLKGQFGVGDVLAHSGDIDPQLIRSTAVAYDGMQVLLSPATANVGSGAGSDYARLEQALRSCRRAFRNTVVDAPRAPHDVAAELARQSQLVLLMFQLNVKDIRLARSRLHGLLDRGIAPECVVPLVSRYERRSGPVRLDDARKALGVRDLATVVNDYRGAVMAVNFGQPLSRAAPKSLLCKDIRRLTDELIYRRSKEQKADTRA